MQDLPRFEPFESFLPTHDATQRADRTKVTLGWSIWQTTLDLQAAIMLADSPEAACREVGPIMEQLRKELLAQICTEVLGVAPPLTEEEVAQMRQFDAIRAEREQRLSAQYEQPAEAASLASPPPPTEIAGGRILRWRAFTPKADAPEGNE